jgi:large repetitive protein
MGFGKKLRDALKGYSLTTQHPVRRNAQRMRRPYCRLGLEALEDRTVPASFSISDVSIIEGNFGTQNALVTVSLTGPNKSGGMSVSYTSASGTAQSGSDYQGVSGTLTFGKNVSSKTIQVPIYGDTTVESDETFSVNLRNPKKATIADGQGVVTIRNDETRISIGNVFLSEGNSGTTGFNFQVTLSHVINQPVTVSYTTGDDTAVAGSDYVAASGTLTIPAGQSSGTIPVLVNGDGLSEFDERFYVNLSSPTIGTIVDSQGFGHIYDDEAHIYISGASVAEGNAGTTAFNFTVTLTSTSDLSVTVDFATADLLGTAGSDYEANSGTLTFAPGETIQIVTVQVNGDISVEADEDFVVNLSNPTNARFDNIQGWGTIQSDDNAVLHIDSYADWEPDPNYGGWTTFYFTVWLSAPATETVTVNFATIDGSAFDGYDYLGSWGQLTFEPGQTSQTIYVSVLPDWEYDPDEYFYVGLSDASSNAVIQPGWENGFGMIYDNQGEWW